MAMLQRKVRMNSYMTGAVGSAPAAVNGTEHDRNSTPLCSWLFGKMTPRDVNASPRAVAL